MYMTILGTAFHVWWIYFFVIMLKYGTTGAGLAASITNFTILIGNIVATSRIEDTKKINCVSFIDSSILHNLGEYLSIGLPGSIIMIFDWGCYQILSIMSGYLGVKEQAAQIILWNLMTIMWQIPFGFQIAACALVG